VLCRISSLSWSRLRWRGDLMTMTVRPRHTKLGLAAREGSWSYASYDLHELKEAFDRAAETGPKWRTFAIPSK
jgi:hypothetical protein